MKKIFEFTQEEYDYITSYGNKNQVTTFTGALKLIIKEHKEADELEDRIVKRIDDKYKNLFTRLRLGTNETDKNVQVILECFNAIASQFNVEPMATDFVETKLIKESRATVKERISKFKQKTDWKK